MYTYRLTPSAVRDLQEIGDYIAKQLYAPKSVVRLLETMREAIEAACAFPLSLPSVNDALLRMRGYRKIVVKSYMVFVLLDTQNEVLQVMRVMYHAHDHLKEL